MITTRLERKPFSAVHIRTVVHTLGGLQKQLIGIIITARGRKQNRLPEENNNFEYGAPLGSFSDLEYLLRYSNKPTHFIFIFFNSKYFFLRDIPALKKQKCQLLLIFSFSIVRNTENLA